MQAATITREQILELLSVRADELADFLLRHLGRNEDFRKAIGEFLRSTKPRDITPFACAPVKADTFMVGESPQMQVVFDSIRKFSTTDVPVLITGETGTGKELAALAIHERSSTADGPFVPVNCGALPPTLIASELFGHEKGAFTGAHQRRIGRLEAAAGGTIFLDEIGDFPLDLQPHLLRFLQERTIERVGGVRPIDVNARVIAATNVDLWKAVQQGKFREDLIYRLNVLTIRMPALRERGDDVTLLAKFFVEKTAMEMNRRVRGFQHDALDAIRRHSWPGNVRELISRIRRAIVVSEDDLLTATDLGFSHDDQAGEDGRLADQPEAATADIAGSTVVPFLDRAKDKIEEALVRAALLRTNRNVTRAARDLGISRVTLYRLMEKYGVGPLRVTPGAHARNSSPARTPH